MSPEFFAHLRAHIALSASALALALAIGLPLGVLAARRPGLRTAILGSVNTARVVPSLAILALAIPILGLGFAPALLALALLAIPPVVVNTDLGLRSVSAALIDAARGLGMTPGEVARRVEVPLALPVVFTGIRTATVEVIASATLAAFIGGGGLGDEIVTGLATGDTSLLLRGALAVALLALAAELALGAVQRSIEVR